MRAARYLAILGVGLNACAANAQAPVASDFDTVVSSYVAEGLRSNLALQSQTLEVDKTAQALAEARARFFPQLSLEARYTRADGGRVIDIPIGTALNPVYSTLNEMLVAQGQPARFPQISDQSVPFLREEEQDTRLVLRQPLYAPAIPAAVRAQRALLDASSFNRMALARALRRDITVAYVDWLTARSSVEIVAASEALLRENLRVNESLFSNGKITEDLVLRAKAELLDVEQQKREAQNLATQAQSYFNFLLNRQLQSPIEPTSPPNNAGASEAALEQLWSMALDRRPEIAQVEQLRRASEEQIRIARKQKWPTLSLGVDAGTQGEEYRFGEGYNFGTASLIFTWRIFDGGGDTARVHQARSAERQLVLRQEEIAQQIRLEVQQSYDRLITARDSLATAAARADAARAAFRIASRKRDEGVISQVEFIDARSALTSAELNHNLTRFNVLARRAELEYATSTGDIPLDPGV
ncbi:TolC family protein [Steroidobacter sp. S1-65]|uniref:TolC family protein n=1 Tax=Steroidobacter gossypii TaxID=2805490 RepID=A0ABS1WTR1_9GAMM|nr:TolC family protein [Steroidobacter gossypii]MBM0104361.1 TolC family protein [Steroidobacter gossypii]